jgi:hypothetical protein
MEKDMSQQDSSVLDKTKKKKILKKYDESLDSCKDNPGDYSFNDYRFSYNHRRPLPKEVARKAIKYIIAIVAAYPFQVRIGVAKPLWDIFCQEWCETGDESKSLRAI